MSKQILVDQAAAFLAACLVAKSDKIQSTRFAVDVWENLRNRLDIKTRFDHLAAVLSQGRVMDLRLNEKNYLNMVQDSYKVIRDELIIKLTHPILGEKPGTEVLANSYIVRVNDIAAAMITSSIVDLSQRVETSKEILEIWDKIREMEIVQNNNEFLTALLVTSRINDLKKEIQEAGELNVIIDNYQNMITNIEPELKVSRKHLAAAYMTIAVITQTPEVESHAQILQIWRQFRRDLPYEDKEADILAAILTGGLIRNMTLKLDMDHIKELFLRIRKQLHERNID
jgi:hypothetical protein